MSYDKKLLLDIADNSAMGLCTLKRLILRCNDDVLRKALADQFAEYYGIHERAGELLLEQGCEHPKRNSPAAIACAQLHINLCIDSTSSHMAEMVMQGSLMGIIDIARSLRENHGASVEAHLLARRLLACEKRNLEEMEQFI